MYSLKIEAPIHATDSNRILGVNRYAKHAIFKKVKEQINILCLGKTPAHPLKSFQISAIRHSPKFMDYDNFIASLKPFIDALVLSGVIQDDSWLFIKNINIDQVKSKEKKMIIKIEEV